MHRQLWYDYKSSIFKCSGSIFHFIHSHETTCNHSYWLGLFWNLVSQHYSGHAHHYCFQFFLPFFLTVTLVREGTVQDDVKRQLANVLVGQDKFFSHSCSFPIRLEWKRSNTVQQTITKLSVLNLFLAGKQIQSKV